MEIKETLNKPCSEQARINFIDNANENGYTIEDEEDRIEAWGYTEEEQQQQRAEYIANLSLTKRDVFMALYNDKGITPDQIKAGITDPGALIELEYASNYYRGNPLIDLIGGSLGYSSSDLDYLFEHKELPKGE